MRPNPSVLLSVFALVAAWQFPGAATAEAPSEGPPPDLLARGLVLARTAADQNARPLSDSTVTVWWIPGLADAKPGQELPIETIASVPVADDGSYVISVAPTRAMQREAAANGGWLNLDIGAVSAVASKAMSTGISRRIINGTWALPVATGDALEGDELPSTPASTKSRTDLVFTDRSPDVAPASTAQGQRTLGADAVTAAETATTGGLAYCSFVTTATPQRSTDVVEFHNAANSDGRWTYGKTADSDIEGGIDYSGDGGWTVGATRHVSNSTGSTVGRAYTGGTKANNYGTSDFEFVDGYYKPYGTGSTCEGTSIPVWSKVKNPVEWVAGVGSNTGTGSEYIGCDQSPQSDHRTSYPVGSFFTRTTNSAAKIGLAVDIGPIRVGAKSGYSDYMDMRWDSRRGHGIRLCGTNSGVTTAGVIHAQNRP